MARASETFARTYPAEPASVARARAEIARFMSVAGGGPRLIDAVRLAVSEAVTNSVRHAYRAGDRGEVRIVALLAGGALEVVVSDDGRGVCADAPRGERGLGFGLGVIAEVADRLTIAPGRGGGTDVRMRFGVRRCANPDPGSAALGGL